MGGSEGETGRGETGRGETGRGETGRGETAPAPAPRDGCKEMLVNVALLSNGINIGLNVGLLGPALPDLAKQTGSTIPEMSVVFVFSSVAYMVGSLLCGLLLGRFEGYLLISVTLILQAATTAIAAWCPNLLLLTTFISLSYFFSTVIIAGTAFLCFRLERARARVMTQSVFLLFNLGKAIVPFILAPFLAPEPVSRKSARQRLPPSWFTRRHSDSSHAVQTDPTHVGFGYAIVAGFSLLMSALYMLVALKHGCHLWASPPEKTKEAEAADAAHMSPVTSKARRAAILLCFFLMILLQCGMETVDAGLLMTFLTEYLHRGTDMGVLASSVYQGVKVIACVVVVLTVRYIHPSCLLFIDFLFMLVSTSLMAVSIHFKVSDGLLWTTFVLLAIGMSNSYATLASWLETQYRITGMVTSILTISFGLGSMLLPPLTTTLLENYGPIMFPLVLLGCSILCFLTYFMTKTLMREVCCPRVDLGDAPVRENVVVPEYRRPLVDGAARAADRGATSRTAVKRQSLSELSPDQCFHAYHSRFIAQPSAPTEHTLLYGSID